jgi:hypothetical protein
VVTVRTSRVVVAMGGRVTAVGGWQVDRADPFLAPAGVPEVPGSLAR